jgi:hypothetical protein
MIFTDTPIKAKTVLVRFYNYSDTEKGWGDAGTAGYYKIDMINFTEEEETRFDGSKYYTYSLDNEVGKKIFGDFWWIGHGYERTTEAKRKKEQQEIEAMFGRIKEVQIISHAK